MTTGRAGERQPRGDRVTFSVLRRFLPVGASQEVAAGRLQEPEGVLERAVGAEPEPAA